MIARIAVVDRRRRVCGPCRTPSARRIWVVRPSDTHHSLADMVRRRESIQAIALTAYGDLAAAPIDIVDSQVCDLLTA